ncbi:hypothetical protein A2Y85_06640 [candidate division WOR-3 bacterium RBG_13_43_14]|uniref:2Fe-2S ferredoxin-type domain-containing protein n=1 Tax=candidate division WOR-3 bacterium RBG_13_43_14 TaxID=1802590 RepID=A0A1F4UG13_UNCW3|nr:MAG: hypothetical protein A2Y85_06640 [candidate division WOR-3 bacterium RBG_13_43_14]
MIKLRVNSGKSLSVRKGEKLIHALSRAGLLITAACGGKGQCGLCQVKILNPNPAGKFENELIPAIKRRQGYRLACRYRIDSDTSVILPVIRSRKRKPISDLGLALDLGTTVIKGSTIDMATGKVNSHAKTYNLQNNYGADIVTRISIALDGKYQILRKLLLNSIMQLTKQLGIRNPINTVVVGNPVMSSFFLNKPLIGLARYPFNSEVNEEHTLTDTPGYVFPAIASFVGGDTLAGILAAGLDRAIEPTLYIDLGTNGEVVLATRERIYVTSTAAGPAFEGVGINSGTLAVPGAVARVFIRQKQIIFQTINKKRPIGFCASGLIDMTAVLLQSGYLKDNGRLRWSFEYKGLLLIQDDIRKLQLSIGAIHTGIKLLLKKAGLSAVKIKKIILTGEFGSTLDPQAMMCIGLLPNIKAKIIGKPDMALNGALMVLKNNKLLRSLKEIKKKCLHVDIAREPSFEKTYIKSLSLTPWN